MAWVSVGMAAVGTLGSIMGNSANNNNLYRSQLGINSGMKSANVQTIDTMSEIHRSAGTALTQLELDELRVSSKVIASMANKGVSGNSAVYAVTNIMQKASFKQGTILNKSETDIINEAKRSQQKHSQTQSKINQLESQKKDTTTMMFDALMAGFQGYSAGLGLQNTMQIGSGFKPPSYVPINSGYHNMLMRNI